MARICRTIERELAAPRGEVAPALMASHVAACPRCARAAAHARTLDLAWSATRPAEPDWDNAWANISRALDAPRPGAATLPMAAARRPAGRRLGFGLAAAAAAVLALGLALRPTTAPPDTPRPAEAPRTPVLASLGPDQVEIEPGEGITIQRFSDEGTMVIDHVAARELDAGNDILNKMEWLSDSSMATLADNSSVW